MVSNQKRWDRFCISTNRYRQFAMVLLALLVGALPVVFNPFGYNMFAATRSMLLHGIALSLCLIILLDLFENGQLQIRKTASDPAVMIFAIIAAISTVFSIHPPTSIRGVIWRYEGLQTWISYVVVYFAAKYAIRGEREQVPILYAAMGSALAISSYAILQHYRIDVIPWAQDQDLSRSISTLGGPTYLGAYLVLMLPLGLSLIFAPRFPRQLRALSAASSLLILLALMFTFARSAWLAVLIAVLFLVILNVRAIFSKKYAAILLIMILLTSASFIAFGKSSPYVERAKSAFNLTKHSSGGIRLYLWRHTLDIIKARPVFGWGLETFSLVFPRYIDIEWEQTVRRDFPTDRVHNDLLQMAASIGVPGMIAYAMIFLLFFIAGFMALRKIQDISQSRLLSGLMSGVLAYIVQMQFNFSIIDVTPIFWIFLGAGACIQAESVSLKNFNLHPLFRVDSSLKRQTTRAGMLIILAIVLLQSVKPVLADIHYRKGQEAMTAGDISMAESELTRAVRRDPSEVYYLQELGKAETRIMSATGDEQALERAISALEQASKINPLNEYTYQFLGEAYLSGAEVLGDQSLLDEAEANFRKVIDNDPNFAKVHLSLGIVYANMGKLEQAIFEWKIVPNLYPESDSAFYNIGQAYEKLGKLPEALENYEKALSVNPDNRAAQEAVERMRKRREKASW